MQQDVEQLLRQLVNADRRAAVWCACQCARSALRWVADGEHRPRVAVETAEAWLAGQASRKDCQYAATNADIAAHVAAHVAAAHAATTAYVATDNYAAYTAAEAAAYAAEAAAHATTHEDGSEPWQQARKQHLQTLHTLVSSLLWPRTLPTAAQLHAAAPHVQVAWDAVCDAPAELAMDQLLIAHDHASALGLDWTNPVQRAVAERVQDVARVRGLLQSAANDADGG